MVDGCLDFSWVSEIVNFVTGFVSWVSGLVSLVLRWHDRMSNHLCTIPKVQLQVHRSMPSLRLSTHWHRCIHYRNKVVATQLHEKSIRQDPEARHKIRGSGSTGNHQLTV